MGEVGGDGDRGSPVWLGPGDFRKAVLLGAVLEVMVRQGAGIWM